MSDERPQLRASRTEKPSFFGDGLPERLRSTSFALLGITVAACLGLVGFAFHQGWPVAPDLPIPGAPPQHGTVQERTVVAEAVAPEGVAGPLGGAETELSRASADSQDGGRGRSQLAAADRVTAEVVSSPEPDLEPTPPTSEEPSSSAPPAPVPTEPPPAESSPPPSAPSPAPFESPPPAASSVDEGEDGGVDDGDEDRDDQGKAKRHDGDEAEGDDDENESTGKGRGWDRPKGGSKHKVPPTPVVPGEKNVSELPTPAPDSGEDSAEAELDEDEAEADDEWDRGRGRGGWRRR